MMNSDYTEGSTRDMSDGRYANDTSREKTAGKGNKVLSELSNLVVPEPKNRNVD